MWKTAIVAIALTLGACGVTLGEGVDNTDDNSDEALSSLGKGVVASLRTKHAGTNGHTWDVAVDDSFGPGWLLQTPPAEYWGQPASALPVATDCTGDSACDPDF